MSGQLSFSYSDAYPTMGGIDTRTQTVPEAEDQNTLVDDEDLAQANPVQVTQTSNRVMWSSIAAVVIIIFLLNVR